MNLRIDSNSLIKYSKFIYSNKYNLKLRRFFYGKENILLQGIMNVIHNLL